MLLRLCCCMGLMFSMLSLASAKTVEKSFPYTKQNSERVTLKIHKKEYQYEDRIVYETCTREVPYTERQCTTVDSGRRECRNQTTYRQECRVEPGHRVCSPGPDREICAGKGSWRFCTKVPGPEVCHNGPDRKVCENKPFIERVCGPAQSEDCRDVTSYRTESYACERTVRGEAREMVTHTYNAEILINFNHLSWVRNALITVSLDDNGKIDYKITGINSTGFDGFFDGRDYKGVVNLMRKDTIELGPDETLEKREVNIKFTHR